MATFEQDGGSFANQILGAGRTTQPKSKITGPVNAGPGSGVAPSHLAGVIKSRPSRLGDCVSLPPFLQRMQYAQYTGAASTGVGSTYNYAYTLAPTVPQGRYWVVEYADTALLGTGTEGYPGLWMLPPGALPAGNAEPYQDNPTIFADTQAIPGEVANGPWVFRGIRVDEADVVSQQDGDGIKKYSTSALIRTRRLIVPQGWTLMVYGGGAGFGNGGAEGEQWLLNLAYSEFLYDEDTDIF